MTYEKNLENPQTINSWLSRCGSRFIYHLCSTKKAYAIVGFDDAAFILAMMAAAGIGFVGYNAYNGSNLAEDLWDELGSLEDDISDAYDKSVFTVLQGGGGGSDPNDFDPDNDDPEKKPTTWAKLIEW